MNWTSRLDFFLPWNFSPTVLAVVVVALTLFTRGARNSVPPTPVGRRFAFYLGLALIYAALQTKWDYYAGHMFFVHRLQHFVLQDVGPFLLAFSAPGSALARGIPTPVRAHLRSVRVAFRPLGRVIFDPWTATAMFVASLCFWLLPPVQFAAMLSNWVYTLMNWSVVVADLPFWWLVLDPRPYPEARVGQGIRILMLTIVMVPMILAGAIIGLSRHNLYPVYGICGRFFPISPLTDQQIGGMIIWIPGSILTIIAALIALSRAMSQAESREQARLADKA